MAQNIHRRKLFGGRQTAEEVHRAYSFRLGEKCGTCPSTKLAIKIRVIADAKEFVRRCPELAAAAAAASPDGGSLPCIDTKYGPMVVVHDVSFCDLCKHQAEIVAARDCPDWALVEIDRGPGPDNPIIAPHSS